MPMPSGIGIIDTMISFPTSDFSQYDFIRKQLKDAQSRDSYDFPVEYMFKNVPKELYGASNPIDITLHEMDRYGIEMGLIGVESEVSQRALKDHPDRFLAQGNVDPNTGMEGVRKMVRQYEEFGVRSFSAFPAGFSLAFRLDGGLKCPAGRRLTRPRAGTKWYRRPWRAQRVGGTARTVLGTLVAFGIRPSTLGREHPWTEGVSAESVSACSQRWCSLEPSRWTCALPRQAACRTTLRARLTIPIRSNLLLCRIPQIHRVTSRRSELRDWPARTLTSRIT